MSAGTRCGALSRRRSSCRFFYKPITLSVLGVAMAILAYVATTQDVLEEGRDKRRVCVSLVIHTEELTTLTARRGAYAAVAGFLLFGIIQFRDGPFIRPHPGTHAQFLILWYPSQYSFSITFDAAVFWRLVLGINLLYELALVFLLFQDLDSARRMMKHLDPNLGRPLPEKSYAENCAFTVSNVWVRRYHWRCAQLFITDALRPPRNGCRTPSTYSASRMPSAGSARR